MVYRAIERLNEIGLRAEYSKEIRVGMEGQYRKVSILSGAQKNSVVYWKTGTKEAEGEAEASG